MCSRLSLPPLTVHARPSCELMPCQLRTMHLVPCGRALLGHSLLDCEGFTRLLRVQLASRWLVSPCSRSLQLATARSTHAACQVRAGL